MEAEGEHITVWVGPEEKIICGLTKHTSCADVVQALFEEQQHKLLGEPSDYCIIERWRGFQHLLPPSTQMLRLCKAWCQEPGHLSFFLVKLQAMKTQSLLKTTNNHCNHYDSAESLVKAFPLHKQKRIVKKVFRKLAKMKKDIHNHKAQMFMQLIAAQDDTIKHQIYRMQELDKVIEEYEARLQNDRENTDQHLACHKYPETLYKEMHNESVVLSNNHHQDSLSKEVYQETNQSENYLFQDTCGTSSKDLCVPSAEKIHLEANILSNNHQCDLCGASTALHQKTNLLTNKLHLNMCVGSSKDLYVGSSKKILQDTTLLINNHHDFCVASSKDQETTPLKTKPLQKLCVGEGKDFEVFMLDSIRKAIAESVEVSIALNSFCTFLQKETHHCNSLLQIKKGQYKTLKRELKSLSDSANQLSFTTLQPHSSFTAINCEELGNISAHSANSHMHSDTESDTGISSTHSQDSNPGL